VVEQPVQDMGGVAISDVDEFAVERGSPESINADLYGNHYRSVEQDDDNRYEEILAMQKDLQNRIEVDEQRQVTHDVFSGMTSREFRV
jgi:hypothetical protein